MEKGQTVVKNCTFRCMADGIVVKQGAELVMEDCKVYGSMVKCEKGYELR